MCARTAAYCAGSELMLPSFTGLMKTLNAPLTWGSHLEPLTGLGFRTSTPSSFPKAFSSLLLLGLKWWVFHTKCNMSYTSLTYLHSCCISIIDSSRRWGRQWMSMRWSTSCLSNDATPRRFPRFTDAPSAPNPIVLFFLSFTPRSEKQLSTTWRRPAKIKQKGSKVLSLMHR